MMYGLKTDITCELPSKHYSLEDYAKGVPRWCPGCGDHAVLANIQKLLREKQLDPAKTVFVSGIGCAAWIPSPLFAADTLHVTHGRPIAHATGIKLCLPEKHVLVASGDGDLAAIGGNHLIHAARRNIGLTVVDKHNG